MSKEFRTCYEKYNNSSAREMVRISCPKVFAILEKMEQYLKDEEIINIYNWTGDRFYIDVVDSSMHAPILNHRMGITFDFRKDKVIFNNDTNEEFKGNCFVRANKWKSWLTKRLPKEILMGEYNENTFHIYKDWRS